MTLAPDQIAETAAREWNSYPEYKESGVEWLEDIPRHWEVQSLKTVASFISRGSGPDYVEKSDIAVINQACIYWDGVRLENVNGVRLENVKFQRQQDVSDWKSFLRQGDLLINSTGTGTLGRAVVFDLQGVFIADSHITIVRVKPEKYDVQYLSYLIGTPAYQGFIYSTLTSGSTNQIELSREGLRGLQFIKPSLAEQRAIASFLDRETERIDSLIAKRRRLIELLEEKKSALISRAVTKGLDPDAPMKDSGIEWLREFPEHWEEKQLKDLTPDARPIMYGIVLPGPNVENGVPIVKGGDVTPDRLRLKLLNRTSHEIEAHYTRSRLQGGNLVYAIRGSIGMVEIVPHELEGANLTQDAARIAPKANVNERWLYYAALSRTTFAQLDARAIGATIRGINIRDLKRAVVPVPLPVEQRKIADYLDKETENLNVLVNKIREHIDKLREYRTALISAAVTGKIDVRDEASSLEAAEDKIGAGEGIGHEDRLA